MLLRFRASLACSGSVGGQLQSAELLRCFRFSAGEGIVLVAWLSPSALERALSWKCVFLMIDVCDRHRYLNSIIPDFNSGLYSVFTF
jgi:hypothetical protein